MDLMDIRFPVYRLLKHPPEWEDDKLVYKNTYMHVDTANEYTYTKIVDARVPGNSLALRRLYLESKNEHLYKIRKAAFFLHDFIKLAGLGYYFIDANGTLFKYKKSIRCRLIFRKVTSIIPSKTMGSIIEVESIPSRFKTMRFIHSKSQLWAGLLKFKGSWLYYGVYNTQYKDTWRMI